MLTEQGRSQGGALNIVRALSAMCEDAITDDLADVNAFKGVKVRASDPRITKQPKQPTVLTFDQMHTFAKAAGKYEAMVRVLADCGLRLGELLGLERRDFDGDTLHVRGTMHEGRWIDGDQVTKRHVRTVPVPASTAALIRQLPVRIDTPLLFPSPGGKVWRESNWRRRVFDPAKTATDDEGRLRFPWAADATPHALRHSWETHLHAAGVDKADLAGDGGAHDRDDAPKGGMCIRCCSRTTR
jgi:integrase